MADRTPPIGRGPYIDPWPPAPGGLPPLDRRRASGLTIPGGLPPLARRRASGLTIPGGNAVAIPPDAVPTFTTQRFAFANGTKVFPVANGASTDIILKPPNYRGFLWLRNSSEVLGGAGNIYVEFGGVASLSSAIRLALNEQMMFDACVLQDDITAYADAANSQLSVLFANIALPAT